MTLRQLVNTVMLDGWVLIAVWDREADDEVAWKKVNCHVMQPGLISTPLLGKEVVYMYSIYDETESRDYLKIVVE